ncbi:hypothetical protein VNI00_015354 [Paramarasmius palmivorus]|uniref:Uncharacterized protein n=1 Tax=Paramarasmius palmivorus TaxID=297713 RepID=A0AAW0BLB1_9AGAR
MSKSSKRKPDDTPLMGPQLPSEKEINEWAKGRPIASLEYLHLATFQERSQNLMAALEAIAKIHPVIEASFFVFKVAMTLEVDRRGNDLRIRVLKFKMYEMMQVLEGLGEIECGKISQRLEQPMASIEASILNCELRCSNYQKRSVFYNYFKSADWRIEFTQIAQEFEDHKAAISHVIQLTMASQTSSTEARLTLMQQDTSQIPDIKENLRMLIEFFFARLPSPEESKVAQFVKEHGGRDTVLESDKTLALLAQHMEPVVEDKGTKGDVHRISWAQKTAELRKELERKVTLVSEEERSFFQKKFEMVQSGLKQVEGELKRQGDRVVTAVTEGPHDRLKDPDMYELWKYMGWKGSVKAKHLVSALRDRFLEGMVNDNSTKIEGELPTPNTGNTMSENNPESNNRIAKVNDGDRWTLQYITVLHLQRLKPLMEAIDDDASSFVTIAEVNAFTTARPLGWSLPHWMAYWTYGFEMTIQWYYRRIRKIFADIYTTTKSTLLANRQNIANFIMSVEIRQVEELLSGLEDVDKWDNTRWDSHPEFCKFQPYVSKIQNKMEIQLRKLTYCIDDASMLALVTGGGRLEKAQTVTLHEGELSTIKGSIKTVMQSVLDRVRSLQAAYRWQNVDEKDKLRKFFYGVYAFVNDPPVMGSYWKRNPLYEGSLLYDSSGEDLDDSEVIKLCFDPETEQLDTIFETTPIASKSENEDVQDDAARDTDRSSRPRRTLLVVRSSAVHPYDARDVSTAPATSDEHRYLLSFPNSEDLSKKQPKALWKLALYHIMRDIGSRSLNRNTILDRRQRRQRYIQLARQEYWNRDEAEEWTRLLETNDPGDLQFWKAVVSFTQRREIDHGRTWAPFPLIVSLFFTEVFDIH